MSEKNGEKYGYRIFLIDVGTGMTEKYFDEKEKIFHFVFSKTLYLCFAAVKAKTSIKIYNNEITYEIFAEELYCFDIYLENQITCCYPDNNGTLVICDIVHDKILNKDNFILGLN